MQREKSMRKDLHLFAIEISLDSWIAFDSEVASMPRDRTALLVRCSEEEAAVIREAARRERRTISGFILNAVLNRITNQKKLEDAWRKTGGAKQARAAVESLE